MWSVWSGLSLGHPATCRHPTGYQTKMRKVYLFISENKVQPTGEIETCTLGAA